MSTPPGTHASQRARTAVYAAFILNGFAFASWVSRIPATRAELDLSSSALGLLLLALSAGAVIAMPLAGAVVMRIGPARTVLAGAAAVAVGTGTVALALAALPSPLLVAAGLFVQGAGTSAWDVAMNVEGADVERRLGRALMPRFHAGYSLGTVLAAGAGSALIALGVPAAPHLAAVGVLALAATALAVRAFLPVAGPSAPQGDDPTPAGLGLRAAWREPRTLLLGLMVCAMAFVEGTANDWIAVAMVDEQGHRTSEAVGVLGFAAFVTAMTVCRVLGPQILDRIGRVPALRGCAVLAVAGVLLFALGSGTGPVLLGAVLWGVGAALGFPLGMSAAADEPHAAAARVSVVSSVAYTAFLAGPPLVGVLGDHVGILRAVLVAAGVAAVALLLAQTARPPARSGVPGAAQPLPGTPPG
ncbi:MFS transporter [Kineococcus glutinatus]|uniref:MFS transporter n=1 Tax=Kineococcus glutinatus TaxID=1070872 RepID=A0ABP9HGN3_9ACTN